MKSIVLVVFGLVLVIAGLALGTESVAVVSAFIGAGALVWSVLEALFVVNRCSVLSVTERMVVAVIVVFIGAGAIVWSVAEVVSVSGVILWAAVLLSCVIVIRTVADAVIAVGAVLLIGVAIAVAVLAFFGDFTLAVSLSLALIGGTLVAFGIATSSQRSRKFKASDTDDAGSTSENPIRDLGKVQYFAGVTIVGTVNAIHENGVTIGFTVSSCYYEGFAPFAEFRDQDLTKEALMSRQLQFALVYPDQAEAYLSVLGADKRRSDNDWPVSIWS